MKLRILTPGFVLFHVLALHGAAAWFKWSQPEPSQMTAALRAEVEDGILQQPEGELAIEDGLFDEGPAPDIEAMVISRSAPAAAPPMNLPGHLDLNSIREQDDIMIGDVGQGWTAELTLDAKLQAIAEHSLKRGRVPYGAVVLMDPASGEVLAMADRVVEDDPAVPPLDPEGPSHVALQASAPAASVFKVITSAALLEDGLRSSSTLCYTPARRRISEENLKSGSTCGVMGDALAHSENGWYARAAHARFEDARPLREMAQRFGFNRVIPFEALTDASWAHVPDNPLERSRMAAGFWHTRLTPLHGALIASTVAEGGRMPRPRMVARVRDPMGQAHEAPLLEPLGRPMSPQQARAVARMMEKTVTHGTGRKTFSNVKKPYNHLRGVSIAGKTGTLYEHTDDRLTRYTWFIGYAPAHNPKVAIAVMVGNGEKWWNKAIHVARYVLNGYFKHYPDEGPQTVALSKGRRG